MYILKNMLSFVKNDKMIFLITVLTVFVSAFVMNFSYGIFYNSQQEKKDFEYIPMEIIGKGTDELNKKKLYEYIFSLSDKTDEQIDSFIAYGKIEPFTEPFIFHFRRSGNNLITDATVIENGKKYGILLGGRFMTDEEYSNGAMVALIETDEPRIINGVPEGNIKDYINEETKRALKDEETVVVDGKEYKIIGYKSIEESPEIPLTTVDDDVKIIGLNIYPHARLTSTAYKEIVNKATGLIEYDFEMSDSGEIMINNNLILISFFISAIAAINFTVLYKYILIKRKKSLAVFRMCGCSVCKAVVMYIAECILITMPVYILSTCVYEIFVKNIFSNIFEYISQAYNLKVYLFIFFLYIILFIIILMISIVKEVNKPINSMLTGSE